MSNRDLLFEIEIDLAAEGMRDASQALYRQLRAAIAGGRLPAGTQLPPTRKSKTFFGVSRNTAAEAYEKLQNEGYVVARHGSGTYIASPLPTGPSYPPLSRHSNEPGRRLNEYWLRPEASQAMGFWWDGPRPPSRASHFRGLDFRPGLIDSRLFPFALLRRVIAKQLRGMERKSARYKSPQGDHYFREAIARHIALTRAVVCQPEAVLITSGAQQAFDLLARVLVTPNRTVVAVEDPGYPPMRVPFAAAGARLVPVAIDAEGMIVEQIPQDADVICVCPSHQFPFGVTMPTRRRRALVELARRCGAVIIEDDYDREFRYDGMPLQALRSSE
jgi:GntR family transcriptional regulator / MocR family aminotransferase